MLLYLDYIAIISFVLFIIMLVVRLRRIRRTGDYSNAGHFTVFFSWLLIIVFFVSISGIAYGAARPAQFNQLTSNLDHHLHSHTKSSNSNQATQKTVVLKHLTVLMNQIHLVHPLKRQMLSGALMIQKLLMAVPLYEFVSLSPLILA